jgi:plasmid stabilization system protein ParE
MKVIYTDEALRDLDEILEFIELHYPAISVAFEERLRAIEQRIESWP